MSKAVLTVTLLVFFFQVPVRSQEQTTQDFYTTELKRNLTATSDSSAKDTILQKLIDVYSDYKPDSALFYAQQRIQLAQAMNWPKKEALATGYYGYLLMRMANYPQAVNHLLNGLQMAKEVKDTADLDFFYDALSNTFIEQGNFDLALSYANQFQNISVRNQDTLLMGWLITKGVLYEKFGYPDSAYFFLQKAFDFDMRKSGDITRERYLLSLGNIYLKKDSLSEALWLYQMAINIANQKKHYENLIDGLNGVAQLYSRTGPRDSGIYYASEALRISQTKFYLPGQLTANNTLAGLYKKKGDKDKALIYLEATIALKDSLFNQQKERAVQNLFFNKRMQDRDSEERERQIQNKWRLYGLIAGILVLLILAAILYRNYRNKQRAYTLLQKQKAETEQARTETLKAFEDLKSAQQQLIQAEKMASLGELAAGIAHEIQNPLNFVNNFSAVNKELLQEMKEEIERGNISEVKVLISDLEANEEKIAYHGSRADGIVKGMLQHARASAGERQPTDINKLVEEYLRLSYQGMRAKDKNFNALVETSFDVTLDSVNIVPQDIGRVLLNLFNNAFYALKQKKQQLNGQYEPKISVCTIKQNGQLVIAIADNGTGIPAKALDKIFQPFFTTKPTGEGTGLGLSLSYDIITKGNGGQIAVNSTEGNGAEFTIKLPVV